MRPGDHGAEPWEGTEPERPIDIEALRADHEFIESLMSGTVQKPIGRGPRGDAARPEADEQPDIDTALRSMLSAWVLDVRPETVTAIENAVLPVPLAPAWLVVPAESDPAALPAAYDPAPDTEPFARVAPLPDLRDRPAPIRYMRRALVAASVVVALTCSGLALGAYRSEPGGTLWPMSRVLYAEHARSVQAAADVHTGLERARTALQDGHIGEAAEAIRAVRASLGQVAPAQGHDELDQIQLQLSVQLAVVDPTVAATLDLPPATSSGVAALAASPATPVPLTDRAAETIPTPVAPTATAPVVTGPFVPVAPAPVPVAPVPLPVAPAPVAPAPDPVAPAPDPVAPEPATPDTHSPDPAVNAPASTAPDPVTAPPVEATTDPQVPPTTVTPAGGTGPDSTGSGDPASAAPAAQSTTADSGQADSPGADSPQAAAPQADPSQAAVDPAHTESVADNLLTTVTNAASDTAQNAEAVADG